MTFTARAQLLAEFLGTGTLVCTVVGSGIMAESLAGGNVAIALLGNTIPTGAILFVLITMLAPISGAHFNPAVTLAFTLRGELEIPKAVKFVIAQITGGILGCLVANYMFDLDVFQISQKIRTGPNQWASEVTATVGLLLTILVCLRSKPDAIPTAVGLYITAAYWFTSSTSFANPAVAVSRVFSNTFAGIRPEDAALFILCQIVGVFVAMVLAKGLLEEK
ncbi:Glycerol uptake facilitator (Major Intrinsic Protein Family) [Cohaesibacter sp. ES.047]|uniref:aquaporin n=1 Tax=Cohaesibacter sp. ES.047 TaxID=1798205 RepID=UPI000BB6B5AD|nr:MIP/aquaporin family protein [Cohaesibacter sp. ES.047]SNY92447.1 Glycerol uptake facilitator (Major Intrinsic Protein Family) [Cohaesibacter sp. ES.047]